MRNKALNWLIIIIGLLLIINLSRSIYDLSQKSKIIEEAKQRVKKVKTENAKLREEYRNAQRDEYIERIAREKLGLGKEGEVVVVLPKNNKAQSSKLKAQKENEEKLEVPVWKQWVKLFL